jgi:predicted dehydrogenase
MESRLRIGVVGTGYGVQHVRAFGAHPRAEVVALCSSDAARAAKAAAGLGVPRAYGDYHAMIDDAPIDAIAVAVPPEVHLLVCAAAFADGCRTQELLDALDRSDAAGKRQELSLTTMAARDDR